MCINYYQIFARFCQKDARVYLDLFVNSLDSHQKKV